jgi:hypothetical protein
MRLKGTLQTPNGEQYSYALYYFGPGGVKDLEENIGTVLLEI